MPMQMDEATRLIDDRMKRRQITLNDRRYLIFYTFEDSPVPPVKNTGSEVRASEPIPRPEASEERNV